MGTQRVKDEQSGKRRLLRDKGRETGENVDMPDVAGSPNNADGDRILRELKELQANAPGWHLERLRRR